MSPESEETLNDFCLICGFLTGVYSAAARELNAGHPLDVEMIREVEAQYMQVTGDLILEGLGDDPASNYARLRLRSLLDQLHAATLALEAAGGEVSRVVRSVWGKTDEKRRSPDDWPEPEGME